MKAGYTISAAGHVVVLAWALVSFVGKPLHTPPAEFFADVISDGGLSQITQGARNAKPAETPKPLVEKIDEVKPAEDPAAKVVDKPEIVPTVEKIERSRSPSRKSRSRRRPN